MAEYISRDDLLTVINANVAEAHNERCSQLLEAILNAPTANVVEVVRCKDCKHATFYSCKNDACYKTIICEYKIGIGDENFYCACAEPRTPKERGGESGEHREV